MSNRLFQGVIHQMKDAIDRTIGVVDETSVVIACSELGRIGEVNESINADTLSATVPFVINGHTFKSFGSSARAEYAVFVSGSDEIAQKYAQLLAVSLSSIKQYYDEKYDRSNFIKNVIMDNILPGDIYLKARELRFNSEVSRVVMLIKITSKTDISAFDVVQNLFPDKSKDFVININETEIALVKEIKQNISSKDLEKLAGSIVDTLSTEFYTHCVVGIGTTVVGIKDLAHSFKEAMVSLEVGKVFDTERTIVSYDNLGIARLRCSSRRSLSAVRSTASIRRRSSPFKSSLRTTSTFPRHPASCSSTATPLFIALRRSKSSPASTSESLRTRSSLRLR